MASWSEMNIPAAMWPSSPSTSTSISSTLPPSITTYISSVKSSPHYSSPPNYFLYSLLCVFCFFGLVGAIYFLVKLYYYYISKHKPPVEAVPAPESVPMVPLAVSVSSEPPVLSLPPVSHSVRSFTTYELQPSKSRDSNLTFEIKPSKSKASNLTFEIV